MQAPRMLIAPVIVWPRDGERTPSVCSRAAEHSASTIRAPYAGKQSLKLAGWKRASERNERARERRTKDALLTCHHATETQLSGREGRFKLTEVMEVNDLNHNGEKCVKRMTLPSHESNGWNEYDDELTEWTAVDIEP